MYSITPFFLSDTFRYIPRNPPWFIFFHLLDFKMRPLFRDHMADFSTALFFFSHRFSEVKIVGLYDQAPAHRQPHEQQRFEATLCQESVPNTSWCQNVD